MFDGVLAVACLDQAQLVRRQRPAIDDNQPLPLTDDALVPPTFSAMEHPMAYTTILDGAAYFYSLFIFILFFFFQIFKQKSIQRVFAQHGTINNSTQN